MNSTLIERAQSWLKGDGIPQLLPGLMAPIDAAKLADDLRLAAQGADRGERDLPASAEANFDPIELDVVGRVGAEASLQRGHLIAMLRAYRDRLAELTAATEIAQLRLAAADAIAKFNQARQQSRGDLARLRQRFVEARNELSDFKLTHNLTRPARSPNNRWTTIGLLIVVVAFESILNGAFFSKGSELGLVGGIVTAVGISIANVGWCFLLGNIPARYANARNFFIKMASLLMTVAGLGAVIALHLFAAHFRDATIALGEDKAFEAAKIGIMSHPANLADINSWYLFGLGVLFGFLAFWKGYGLDDPYPGYGSVFRRAAEAEDEYNREHHEFFDELDATRDTTIDAFKAGIANIPGYAAKAQQIRAARSALLEQFRNYEQQIEQIVNRLLAVYRDANTRCRKTAVPEHFRSQWVSSGSTLVGADILALTTDTADSVIANVEATLEELKALSEQVLLAYGRLMDAVEHPTDMT